MTDSIDPKINTSASSAEAEHNLTSSNEVDFGGCPVTWCDQHKIGHPIEGTDCAGRDVRTHTTDCGYLSKGPGPAGEVAVDIVALETLEGDWREGERRSQVATPQVSLYASAAYLTPDEARSVAAMLTAAADKLDAIAGGR